MPHINPHSSLAFFNVGFGGAFSYKAGISGSARLSSGAGRTRTGAHNCLLSRSSSVSSTTQTRPTGEFWTQAAPAPKAWCNPYAERATLNKKSKPKCELVHIPPFAIVRCCQPTNDRYEHARSTRPTAMCLLQSPQHPQKRSDDRL